MDAILDLVIAQLSDPFRIGLLAALALTAANTAAQTGRVIPLALGLVFVAVLIPLTMGREQPDQITPIWVGLISNAIILAVVLGLQFLWTRFASRQRS
ncbi:MAG: hypothetical protein AB7S80_11535 [Rhizobiaceae bacterium]